MVEEAVARQASLALAAQEAAAALARQGAREEAAPLYLPTSPLHLPYTSLYLPTSPVYLPISPQGAREEAVLARCALEEEARRRRGGGGEEGDARLKQATAAKVSSPS